MSRHTPEAPEVVRPTCADNRGQADQDDQDDWESEVKTL